MNQITDYELTTNILISMIVGIVVGLFINFSGWNSDGSFIDVYIVNGLFSLLGTMFILLLKMLVVPLVFFSLIAGVIAIGNISMLGRIGIKSFLFYMFTTAMATLTAMALAILISPGSTGHISLEGISYSEKETPAFTDVLSGIIPSNIFDAFSSGNMLQVIFFSVFFAVAYLLLGKRNIGIEEGIETVNQTIMKMVHLVTKIAPYAVFALIAQPIAELGMDILFELSSYILVLILALLIHLFITLMLLLKFTTGLSPRVFLSKIRDTQLFAFSTASSNATMPSTLQSLTEKMGVKNSVASFTVPFGATINMDGTAIMQGVATVFVANAYGIELTNYHYMTIIGMSVLASIGTAGVPGVGLIMLSMVFVQVGIPVAGIGLLLGVDRLLDMIRTAVNVSGDAVVTCIVAKQEGQLDESVFYNFRAGLSEEDLTEAETKRVLEAMLKSNKYEVEIDDDGKQGMIRLKED